MTNTHKNVLEYMTEKNSAEIGIGNNFLAIMPSLCVHWS